MPEPPDALDAKQLVIRDVEGQMRVAMLVADDGPGLVFYDADGQVAWQAPPVTQPLPDDPEKRSSRL